LARCRVRKSERMPSKQALVQLHVLTAGWAAGLVLLLERSGDAVMSAADLAARDLQDVFDYFATEIFDSVDSETREFLSRSAFLPTLQVATCARVTGVRDADQFIKRLNRDNFFVEA